MHWIWVAGTWVTLAVVVSLVVARSIRLADRRAAEPRAEDRVDSEPRDAPAAPVLPLHGRHRSHAADGPWGAGANRVPFHGRDRRAGDRRAR
jgi:hypothetical protein